MGATNTTNLQILLTTDGEGNVTASLGRVVVGVRQVKPAADESTAALLQIKDKLEIVKGVMEAWGVYEGVKEVVGGFIEANTQATQFKATLIAVTGSQAEANAVYAELGDIADATTAKTSQLVDAYVRLRNAGITPTSETLVSLANVAVGTGTTVDQVANAMAMAFEGNARGLKQLGIISQEAGDKLILSFQGQKTVIDNTAQGLQDFFNKFGQSSQFIEAQQARVNSLAGSWEQLGKRVEDFDVALAKSDVNGASFVSRLSQMVQMYTQLQQAGKDPIGMLFAGGGPANLLAGQSINMFNFAQMQQQRAQGQQMVETLKQIAEQSAFANTAEDVYNTTLGRIATTLGMVVAAHQRENTELAEAASNTALANAAADKSTTAMASQAQSMGLTHAQAVLLRIGTGDLALADGEHARAALVAAQALDVKTESFKANAKYQAQLVADQSYIENLQKQLDLVGATQNQQILYNAALAAGKAANDADRDAILARADALITANQALAESNQLEKQHKEDQQDNDAEIQHILDIKDALKQVDDALSPADAAWDKYIQQMNTLDDALQTLGPEYDDVIAKLKLLSKQQLDTTNAGIDGSKAWEMELVKAADNFGTALSDALSSGMKDGGKKLLEDSQKIFQQLEQFWIKQHIIIPLQQQMQGKGDGISSGDALLAGGAFVGSAVGGAVGGKTGGFISGAIGGAMAAAPSGNPYAIIAAAIIGGIMGALSSQAPKIPEVTISGSGAGTSRFSDSLGTLGIAGKHVNDDIVRQIEQQIEQFDDALSQFLPADQVQRVQDAIKNINTSFTGQNPEAVEKAHLDAVMAAIMPQFKSFVDGISGIANELKAFQALRTLQDDLKNTQSTVTQLTGSPLQKLQDQLKALTKNIADDGDRLNAAIKLRDPTQIVSAEQALRAAVIARYQAEMQDIQNLLSAEQNLEQSSFSLNESLAQKIGQLTGDWSGAADTAAARIADLQAQITSDLDFGDALNKVQELATAVDNWLSSAIAQVQSQYDAQIQALEDQKSALQMQSQSHSASGNANQAQIQALQQQLALAQAWLAVLDNAKQAMQSLQTGSSNPLGGFSQLDMLNQIIAQKFAALGSGTGKDQSANASALLADLQQRLQLIQQAGLMDRSSPAYLAAYNQTMAQIQQIKDLAAPKASQVDALQAQLDALNSLRNVTTRGFSIDNSALTDLNTKEDALKAQEKEQIDALNKQAADYYTWAQGEAQALEAARHKEIVDQLQLITGGVDPTQYIARESTAMAASLDSIDQQITDFLNAISGNVTNGSGGTVPGTGTGGGGGGGGNHGGSHTSSVGGGGGTTNVQVHVTVNGTGMGSQDIADAVTTHIAANIGPLANALKRELKAA